MFGCTKHKSVEDEIFESDPKAVTDELMSFAPSAAEKALARLASTICQIPENEARVLRVGVHTAVITGLRVAQSFAGDREQIAASFAPDAFDPAEHDDLEDRALALWHADLLLRDAGEQAGSSPDLLDQAKQMRARLLKAAEYLWNNDSELRDLVADIRSHRGRADMADDLARLRRLFVEHWPEAKASCSLTSKDLEQAKDLGKAVINALSRGEADELADLRLLRDRAAEHLRRGIDDVRAAAAFVFRDDPASLAKYPGLYSSRNRRNGATRPKPSDPSQVEEAPLSGPTEPQPLTDPIA
jgi:hypothetical protein